MPDRIPVRYRRPKPIEVLEGQMGLFDTAADQPGTPAEALRGRALKDQLARWEYAAAKQIEAIKIVRELSERGIQYPDIAAALGLPPIIARKSRPLRPWRLRPESNMAIVAEMLETVGTKGASESEMEAVLRGFGRLGAARGPGRSVHWTICELRRRTQFCYRASAAEGGRWYAYGRFDAWRSAQKSKVAKSVRAGDDVVQLHTQADSGRAT